MTKHWAWVHWASVITLCQGARVPQQHQVSSLKWVSLEKSTLKSRWSCHSKLKQVLHKRLKLETLIWSIPMFLALKMEKLRKAKSGNESPKGAQQDACLTPSLVLFLHWPCSKFQTFMKDLGFKLRRQAEKPCVSEGRWKCFLYFSKREMSPDPLKIQDTSKADLLVRMSPQRPVPFTKAAEHPS